MKFSNKTCDFSDVGDLTLEFCHQQLRHVTNIFFWLFRVKYDYRLNRQKLKPNAIESGVRRTKTYSTVRTELRWIFYSEEIKSFTNWPFRSVSTGNFPWSWTTHRSKKLKNHLRDNSANELRIWTVLYNWNLVGKLLVLSIVWITKVRRLYQRICIATYILIALYSAWKDFSQYVL